MRETRLRTLRRGYGIPGNVEEVAAIALTFLGLTHLLVYC
jgi:hypothetical protein